MICLWAEHQSYAFREYFVFNIMFNFSEPNICMAHPHFIKNWKNGELCYCSDRVFGTLFNFFFFFWLLRPFYLDAFDRLANLAWNSSKQDKASFLAHLRKTWTCWRKLNKHESLTFCFKLALSSSELIIGKYVSILHMLADDWYRAHAVSLAGDQEKPSLCMTHHC